MVIVDYEFWYTGNCGCVGFRQWGVSVNAYLIESSGRDRGLKFGLMINGVVMV